MTFDLVEQDIELANGAIAHFTSCGPSDGAPVILLHGGLPGSSGRAGWASMLRALGNAGFRALAPDCPGFGKADTRPQYWPVRGTLTWTVFVNDFANAVGLTTFGLAGNSQGAKVAATYAVQFPERVEKLALVASGGLNDPLDIPKEQLAPGILPPRFDGTEESMRAMLELILFRPDSLSDELIKMRTEAANTQRESSAAAAAWDKDKILKDEGIRQAHRLVGHLDHLTIPIIYLYGRDDVLGPVQNGYLQEDRLPNVQFFYPADCGHQGQTDQPELFERVFTEFFTSGYVTSDTAQLAGVSMRRPPLAEIVRN